MEETSEEFLASPHAMLPSSVAPMSGRGRARYDVDDSMEGLRTSAADTAVCQRLQSCEVRTTCTL